MSTRGPYSKGIAKREEILEQAVQVIARDGFAGASVRALSQAVGLSQAGLLHYFDSKEELFTAILRKRDEIEIEQVGSAEPPLAQLEAGYLRAVNHNAETPGMILLFSRLAVDAADPAHPAHDYFLDRTALVRRAFKNAIDQARSDGRLKSTYDSDMLARIVQAITDGIQLQWLVDPTVDMSGIISTVFELIEAEPPQRGDEPQLAPAPPAESS